MLSMQKPSHIAEGILQDHHSREYRVSPEEVRDLELHFNQEWISGIIYERTRTGLNRRLRMIRDHSISIRVRTWFLKTMHEVNHGVLQLSGEWGHIPKETK